MGTKIEEAGAAGDCNVSAARAAKIDFISIIIDLLGTPEGASLADDIIAIEAKLDNPDNFKADVSALAMF